jgi:hypothetical protein
MRTAIESLDFVRRAPEPVKQRRFVIGSVLLSACILISGCSEEATWPSQNFSSEKWKKAPESQRHIYVKSLIRSKLLLGKSREGALELLGPPSSENAVPYELIYVVKIGSSTWTLNQVFALRLLLGGEKGEVTAAGISAD